MTQSIESLFPTVKSPMLVLDSWDYIQRLLMHGNDFPWLDPVAFESVYRQMIGLLRPQLATLDLNRLVFAHAARYPELHETMKRRPRLSFPMKTLLADPALAQCLKQLIAATRDARGNRPLVLTMSTPLDLLGQLYELAHGQPMPTESQDDAERAAVYLADFLTRSTQDGVAALMLIDRDAKAAQSGFTEAISPVKNLSHHMRWKLLMATQAASHAIKGIDWVWTPKNPQSHWLHDFLAAEKHTSTATVFAEIPPHAQPEQVLAKLALFV